MLATETARNPFVSHNMNSFHSRGNLNGSTTSFASSVNSSQSGKYGSSSTMRSDFSGGSQQGQFTPLSATMSPSPPEIPKPEQSIMNRRAGADSSLYQICMNLRSRLQTVPGFEGHMVEMEEEEAETADSIDPVTLMWNSLRRGYPLMTVYNALRPPKPLDVDPTRVKEKDRPKAATFKFLQACMSELKFHPSECFLITDLYQEDTTGFVKVTKVVNKVLDILKEKQLLHYRGPTRSVPSDSIPQTLSRRQHIIDEIVKTERDYVQHLEMLQHFQNEVSTSGAIPGDAVHEIFLNLNALLDFQRRFLIRIEQQNSLTESEQNWGKLFSHYKDSFRVYEPFIANQKRCNSAVINRWKELQKVALSRDLQGMVETPAILLGFLIKPFQRLSRYPLLLKDLEKQGDYDEAHSYDLRDGWKAADSILTRADEAVAKENRLQAVSELRGRVEDWKGHRIEHFGDLLLYGTYTVLKGEGAREVEREVSEIFSILDPKSRAVVRAASRHAPGFPAQASPQRHSPIRLSPESSSPQSLDGLEPDMKGLVALGLFNGTISPEPKDQCPDTTSGASDSLQASVKTLSGYKSQLREAILHPGHLVHFNGPFSHTTCFHFSHIDWPHMRRQHREDRMERDLTRPTTELGSKSEDPLILQEEHEKAAPIVPSKLEKQAIDELLVNEPEREQYKVYLFERILLCCKEINPNKPKNKMLSTNKPLVDKKGKLKLQLKGRIFMQNVTDVVAVKRTDSQSYTIQIFWKGDPGVENFVIRFNDEASMKSWQEAVQRQKKILTETARGSGQTGTSTTEFEYLRSQPRGPNPYREEEDGDDDDMQSSQIIEPDGSQFAVSRNASNTSLRSATGPSLRMALPKFPMHDNTNGNINGLSLNTNIPSAGPSPGEFPGNSYFSPTADSPLSTRSRESQQPLYPFSQAQTSRGAWNYDENKHRTAPAIGRAPSREGPNGPDSYVLNGRSVVRPSLPVMPASNYSQQSTQSRLRSASTPNIHDPNAPGGRRAGNGQPQAQDNVPVPPLPPHMAHERSLINRSQTASPTDQLPIRSAHHSPSTQRDRQARTHQDQYNHYYQAQQRLPPTSEPFIENPISLSHSSSISSAEHEDDIPYPPQLKVTIWFDPSPSHVTIVVPSSIKHRSLIDRIDSKMVKVSAASIAKGSARLRYKDSDNDIVTITSDEDVQLAIDDWGTSNLDQLREGIYPDFQLFWQPQST